MNASTGSISIAMLAELPVGEGFWYLATPYSRHPSGIDGAFIDACIAAAKLIKAGIPVYSPIAHSHPIADHGGINPYDHKIWLPADKPMMKAAYGLIVAKLDTWETSFGIKVEIEEFVLAKKPVIYLEKEDLL